MCSDQGHRFHKLQLLCALLLGISAPIVLLLIKEFPGMMGLKRFQSLPKGTPVEFVIRSLGPPLKTVKPGDQITEELLVSQNIQAPSSGCLLIYHVRLSTILVLVYFDSDDELEKIEYIGD